ncbi:MAG: phage baseplate assembly protein V [Pseudomonadota bacterium]
MNKLINSIKTQAGLVVSGSEFATTGIVTQINESNSSLVMVKISEAFSNQPALTTGWIPVLSPWAGNGSGFFAPPQYNDLVLLIFANGSTQNPLAALRIFNDEDQALNVPPGECWLVHKSGSFLKLTNDGKILINSEVEIDLSAPIVKITATTSCEVNSPSIKLGNTLLPLKKLINDTFITLFNNHIHPTPSGNSSPPTVPATSTNATTHAEAN